MVVILALVLALGCAIIAAININKAVYDLTRTKLNIVCSFIFTTGALAALYWMDTLIK